MARLEPRESYVTVRMYRQGHGDCFLLSTRGDDGDPVYVLIDCGLWNGSQVAGGPSIAAVVADIAEATGAMEATDGAEARKGRLDVLAITHEHKDHVSGFLAKADDGTSAWDAIEIGELWLAWTEDEKDDDANALRRRFDDTLRGLAAAAARPETFGLDADPRRLELLRDIVELHTGEDPALAASEVLGLAGGLAAVKGISNKEAIKAMRDKAERIRFLAPERGPQAVPRAAGLRVFALGPPRDRKLLLDLDPRPGEGFGLDGAARTILGTLTGEAVAGRPFSRRHGTAPGDLQGGDRTFFEDRYGTAENHPEAWRRIDGDWAEVTEALALRLHHEVNNTSLVLAFELPRTRKVLLFTGDAQRGSWLSWAPLAWGKGAGRVTAKDLLGRVALYKVGHHGSHNATLKGRASDAYPNLGWLGQGEAAEEFVALIPANKPWANDKKKWQHPLDDLEAALIAKAAGRVLRLDEGAVPKRPAGPSEARWQRFLSNTEVTTLYAEHRVPD